MRASKDEAAFEIIGKDRVVNITKAVITAAGRNQRTLPLQTLVDRDGARKSVLGIIVEEAGGRSTNLKGERSIYTGAFVSTNGKLHDDVLKLLQ